MNQQLEPTQQSNKKMGICWRTDNMRRLMNITLTIVFMLTLVSPAIVHAEYVKSSGQDLYSGVDNDRLSLVRKASLEHINQIRNEMGLPLWSFDDSLQQAAQAHSQYENSIDKQKDVIDKSFHWEETTTNPWYTSFNADDRAAFFGYPEGREVEVSEVAHSGVIFHDPSGALQSLIDAPFHRTSLLDPSYRDFGLGETAFTTVINMGHKAKTVQPIENQQIVYYPYDGQKNSPTSWWNMETPNPLAYYDIIGTQVGYPITISGDQGNIAYFESLSASIVDSNGQAVDYYVVDHNHFIGQSGYGGGDTVILIPKKPLKGSTTYTVTAAFRAFEYGEEVRSIDKTKTWSFTTKPNQLASIEVGKAEPLHLDGTVQPQVKAVYDDDARYDVTTQAEFSSDSNLIRIDQGTITGLAPGNAKVTVKYQGKTTDFFLEIKGYLSAYSDITGHWAMDTIAWASKLGIAKGYPDGSFHPDDTITEAEFLAVLFNSYPEDTEKWGKGPDGIHPVRKLWSDEFYSYALSFNIEFLMNSFEDSQLRNIKVTRAKVAQIITGLSGKHYDQDEAAIQYLLNTGYSKGKNSASVEGYAGGEYLSRAEALQFVRNLKDQGLINLYLRPIPSTTVSDREKNGGFPNLTFKLSYNPDKSITVTGTVVPYANKTITIAVLQPLLDGLGERYSYKVYKTYDIPVNSDGEVNLQTEPIEGLDKVLAEITLDPYSEYYVPATELVINSTNIVPVYPKNYLDR
jgi:hypothetical protein